MQHHQDTPVGCSPWLTFEGMYRAIEAADGNEMRRAREEARRVGASELVKMLDDSIRLLCSIAPTREEFIRDQLAEHLDGVGYDVETTDHGAQLTADSAHGTVTVEIVWRRGIVDIDTGERLLFPGFSWRTEPTDTGVMHGPWLAGARVSTPDGRGIAQPSEFGALDVVRVVLDGMNGHPGYCYPRCYVWLVGSRGAREVELRGVSTR